MATSGSYSFTVTRDDIIRQALLNIGKLDRYETPNAILVKDCAIVLNMMVKQMMGNTNYQTGLKVWTRKRGHLFLSNFTGRYPVGPGAIGWTNDYAFPVLAASAAYAAGSVTLSALSGVGTSPIAVGCNIGICLDNGSLFWTTISALVGMVATLATPLQGSAASGQQVFIYQTPAQIPLAIESAVLRYQDLSDVPLQVMRTTQDYDILSNKAQVAYNQDPTAIYFETQLINSYIYIDAGSAYDLTKHIVLTYMEPVQDFVNPTDNPYYPPEYFLTLCWGLSKLICPQLNRVWTPAMESTYATVMKVGTNKDPENTSIFFQPGVE